MAGPRRFELDELSVRPGTYFNPETEVLIVVDDSPEVEQALFDEGAAEGGEWVLVSDEVPVDESARDELLERFQVRYRGGTPTAAFDEAEEEDEEDEDDGPEELHADEPHEEEDDL
jgi:hypothetical protein